MSFDVENIVGILNEIGNSSKNYVNVSKRGLDSGEYLKQIWITRYNKTKAKNELIKVDNIEDSDIIKFLLDMNIITKLTIEDGDYKDNHFFSLPISLELIKLLIKYNDITIDEKKFGELIQEANKLFVCRSAEEIINRIQEPLLEAETMSAKSVLFCWYLLITGAISKRSSFILRVRDEDKEFDLHDEIVDYLDCLSKYIYPSSYLVNKSGKSFKRGDLSNFVRRNKDIRTSFGDIFHTEDSYFYFDIEKEDGEIDKDILERVINITLKRLKHFASEQDYVCDTVMKSITWFRVDSPIKQAHRTSLFLGKPTEEYYPMLEHLVYEALLLTE